VVIDPSVKFVWLMKAVLSVLLLAACFGFAQSSNDVAMLERKLNGSMAGKQVLIRFPYASKKVEMDGDGKCVSHCERGGWASDGTLRVDRARLQGTVLDIFAKHLVIYYDLNGQRVGIERPGQYDLHITLAAPASEELITELLKRIFQTQGEPVLNGPPPDPARLTGDYERKEGDQNYYRRKGTSDEWQKSAEINDAIEAGATAAGEKVFIVSKLVKPPLVIKAPDPQFPESARQQKQQGTTIFVSVIDATGHVQSLRVTREGFPGFPGAAAEAISQWTFRPATREGQPVASVINVEVNFRLY
jgi:TonB family protein